MVILRSSEDTEMWSRFAAAALTGLTSAHADDGAWCDGLGLAAKRAASHADELLKEYHARTNP